MKTNLNFLAAFYAKFVGAKDPFTGFSVSAAFPLFGASAYHSKVKVAQADMAIQQKQFDYSKQVLNTQQLVRQQEIARNRSMLSFYEKAGLKQANEIIKAASLAYRAGEISFAELSQFLTQAIEIQKITWRISMFITILLFSTIITSINKI